MKKGYSGILIGTGNKRMSNTVIVQDEIIRVCSKNGKAQRYITMA